jgi:hypothetical protein
MPAPPSRRSIGVKVYVNVQDQAVLPSGECAKIRHGFRAYRHVASNLHSHVVAVTEQDFFHILDCVGRVPHLSSPKRVERPFGYSLFEATLQSRFAQSARAVALTVSPHTQVQVSLSSFRPTLCSVLLPALMVHCPNDGIDPGVGSGDEWLLHQSDARIIEDPNPMVLVGAFGGAEKQRVETSCSRAMRLGGSRRTV